MAPNSSDMLCVIWGRCVRLLNRQIYVAFLLYIHLCCILQLSFTPRWGHVACWWCQIVRTLRRSPVLWNDLVGCVGRQIDFPGPRRLAYWRQWLLPWKIRGRVVTRNQIHSNLTQYFYSKLTFHVYNEICFLGVLWWSLPQPHYDAIRLLEGFTPLTV